MNSNILVSITIKKHIHNNQKILILAFVPMPLKTGMGVICIIGTCFLVGVFLLFYFE